MEIRDSVMSICKIYTLKDLSDTGLKVFDSCRYADDEVAIDEPYLKGSVISQWDWKDYSDYYVFYDNGIKEIVKICVKQDNGITKCENLKNDLSNIKPTPTKQESNNGHIKSESS
jgi:hypothetical protein